MAAASPSWLLKAGIAAWGALVLATAPLCVRAQGAETLRDADLELGEKLISEHKCGECHARRLGGDGSAIYRPKGRINSAARLRGMVERCSIQLNLSLFPEEVDAIAAVLNRDHYKFK